MVVEKNLNLFEVLNFCEYYCKWSVRINEEEKHSNLLEFFIMEQSTSQRILLNMESLSILLWFQYENLVFYYTEHGLVFKDQVIWQW